MIKLTELVPQRQLNELSLRSVGNKVKTILNKVALKKGKKDAEDLQQSDVAAAIPSTSLKKYLGQLKAIISPLYQLQLQEIKSRQKLVEQLQWKWVYLS